MDVSIIIACRENNPHLQECLKHCLELKYPDFEIFILPDDKFAYNNPKVKIITTGPISPPMKRNKILGLARGELFAFIDDDAYPREDWLGVAAKYFGNADISAIGGPAITPQTDSLTQIASGLIYESVLVSDGFTYRYRPGKLREVEDYPSCNFIIRREIFEKLGGFKTKFWPGEDTFLCLEITKKLHKKILYVPELVVFHHRRSLFKAHLKQVANYALHRGYFAKRFPQTSLKLSYFIPSLFVISIVLLGTLGLFLPRFKPFPILFIDLYLMLVLLTALLNLCNLLLNRRQHKFNLRNLCSLTFLVFSGIIITHFTYGIYFIKGLFARKMREE